MGINANWIGCLIAAMMLLNVSIIGVMLIPLDIKDAERADPYNETPPYWVVLASENYTIIICNTEAHTSTIPLCNGCVVLGPCLCTPQNRSTTYQVS